MTNYRKDIPTIQHGIRCWTNHNFPNQQPWEPLLGLQEEVGELSHAYLKRHQGIRKNENHDLNIRDAVADIMIYLLNFCNHEGINLEEQLFKTWERVSKRDWKKNPDQITTNEEIISQTAILEHYSHKPSLKNALFIEGYGVDITDPTTFTRVENPDGSITLKGHPVVVPITIKDAIKPVLPEDEKPRFCPKEEWEERKKARERGEFPGAFKFPGHTPDPPSDAARRSTDLKPLPTDHPRRQNIEGDAWL